MKIESIIKRKLGTKVEIGDMTYHFTATVTDPRHLCEVTNEAHIERFLSIKEGYREAEGKAPKAEKPAEVKTLVTTIVEADKLLDEAKADKKPAEPAPAEVKTETPAAPAEVIAPAETLKPAAGVEIDRDALLVEAKALKIKSAHLFGNERLVQAVAAAKANG